MTDIDVETFERFWDLYVAEHEKRSARVLRFVGTTAALGCVAGGLLTKRRWLLLLAPVLTFGPPRVASLFKEQTPIALRYPLWGVRADFQMWFKMLTGQMRAEVERVVSQSKANASEDVRVDADSAGVEAHHETVN